MQRTDPTAGYPAINPNTVTATTNGPLVNSYDSFGRRSAVTYPDRGTSSIVYDAVDSPSGDYGDGPIPILYNVRKELIATVGGGGNAQPTGYTANGHLSVGLQCAPRANCDLDPSLQTTETFDLVDGKTLSTTSGFGDAAVQMTTNYVYDVGGRETQVSSSGCTQYNGQSGASGGSSTVTNTAYDAEDHVANVQFAGTDYDGNCAPVDSATASIAIIWGPNLHPAVVQSTSQGYVSTAALHWDGDSVLFTSDTTGVHDVKIGALGDATVDSGYFYVYDRSQDGGALVDTHSTISAGLAPPPCGTPGNGAVRDCVDIYEPTDESITTPNLGITVQGARGIDTSTSAWMSPDASSGSIHDPLTQVPYVFEHNNSIVYSDPTGFASADSLQAWEDEHWDDGNLIANGVGGAFVANGEQELTALELQDSAQSAVTKALANHDPISSNTMLQIQKTMSNNGFPMQPRNQGLVFSRNGVNVTIYPSEKPTGGSIQSDITAGNLESRQAWAAFRNQFSNRFWRDSGGGLRMGPRAEGAPGISLPRPLERSFIYSNRNDE